MPVTSPHETVSIPATTGTALAGYRGRAFLYVLVAAGPEDLLKVGMSGDPLARWSSFHPRWFEAFDLEHSLLVETEARRDAQPLETQLHRQLVAHHCPVPMTMRSQAGGGTEWYRGAYAETRRFVEARETEGFVVHRAATTWLAARMQQQQDRLEGLLRHAHAEHGAGCLSPAQRQALRDLLDAHRHFDPTLPARLPIDVLDELGLSA